MAPTGEGNRTSCLTRTGCFIAFPFLPLVSSNASEGSAGDLAWQARLAGSLASGRRYTRLFLLPSATALNIRSTLVCPSQIGDRKGTATSVQSPWPEGCTAVPKQRCRPACGGRLTRLDQPRGLHLSLQSFEAVQFRRSETRGRKPVWASSCAAASGRRPRCCFRRDRARRPRSSRRCTRAVARAGRCRWPRAPVPRDASGRRRLRPTR